MYESLRPSAQELVFRRGAEVTEEACAGVAQPGEHWLDVGCGTGHLASRLAKLGVDVTGVDRDAEMVAAATRRFAGPSFIVGDAEALPFEHDSVDGVVATSLVGCLGDDGHRFLAEAARVLRSGGYAVVTFTNRESVLHKAGAITRQHSSLVVPVRTYSTAEARERLEAAGLTVTAVRYYNAFISVGRVTVPPLRLSLALERAGRFVGRNVLTVSRKR